ncbi:MAG: amino acid ABC transporter permease [Hyphomicrobiaceae bacterium]
MAMSRPTVGGPGPLVWVQQNLFNSVGNGITTILLLAALFYAVNGLVQWGVVEAIVRVAPEECRVSKGACWGFITEKHRLMLFGTYPYAEQWRPLVASILLVALVVATCNPRWWGIGMVIAWGIGVPTILILMGGGLFGFKFPGFTQVDTSEWGGLPLTLILATVGVFLSFPLAILLALGRQSNLPAIKAVCIGFIEIIRGVPLITILFMASLMIPLFLPSGVNTDKLIRAQIGFIFFAAAYVAEVIRGGLAAIPKGQYEAADALGLSYWHKTIFIILPQALKLVIVPMMNTFIGLFKDTSLVIIIGMFDLLGAVQLSSNDPVWRAFYVEGLVFAAVIYFVICYSMSRYARHLEHSLDTSRR